MTENTTLGQTSSTQTNGSNDSNNFLAVAILFAAVIIAGSIWMSADTVSNSMLTVGGALMEKGVNLNLNSVNTNNNAPAQAQPKPSVPTQQPTKPSEPAPIKVNTEGRPVIGDKNAPVTIVEFSDFQCPYCGRAYSTVNQLLDKYKGKIKVVFMEFPLGFHPYAQKAAEAAECAFDQGKFWEMHDVLFESKKLTVDDLKQHADDLGLDTEKFNSCLDNGDKADVVKATSQLGASIGISGTPSFIINGKKVVGAQPYNVFAQTIDAALKK